MWLKTRQQAQNGVAYTAACHQTEAPLYFSVLPETGIVNQSIRNHLSSSRPEICLIESCHSWKQPS